MKRGHLYLIIVFLLIAFSCKHDDPYYSLRITVLLDGTTSPCPGAVVTLGTTNQTLIKQTLTTGPLGTVDFTYKLPAIINASASFTRDSVIFYEGTAVIRLEENNMVAKSLYVKKI